MLKKQPMKLSLGDYWKPRLHLRFDITNGDAPPDPDNTDFESTVLCQDPDGNLGKINLPYSITGR